MQRKPLKPPKKWKAKEPKVQVVESDDDGLSLDTSKVTKKSKNVKTSDAISQQKTNIQI